MSENIKEACCAIEKLEIKGNSLADESREIEDVKKSKEHKKKLRTEIVKSCIKTLETIVAAKLLVIDRLRKKLKVMSK